MLTLEQRRLVLKEIRMIVDEAVESYKNAINEGLDEIIENEEMQELFDQVVETISDNLADEIWEEDYEQTSLQSMDIDLLETLEDEFRTEFGNLCDTIEDYDSETFHDAIVALAEKFSIRAEKDYGVAEDVAFANFYQQTIWDENEDGDEDFDQAVINEQNSQLGKQIRERYNLDEDDEDSYTIIS